jgi:hypothetical protein
MNEGGDRQSLSSGAGGVPRRSSNTPNYRSRMSVTTGRRISVSDTQDSRAAGLHCLPTLRRFATPSGAVPTIDDLLSQGVNVRMHA